MICVFIGLYQPDTTHEGSAWSSVPQRVPKRRGSGTVPTTSAGAASVDVGCITGLMLFDLETQESVDCGDGLSISRSDGDAAPARSLLE